ncbi:MAG: ribosome biogenesis GTPase YlqF [Firmicutes bacterium]|nr:ribosome biogenesis GTPase YlqF [Bacillota bacterium]
MAHWFPGHMARAKREIAENIKLVDAVFELIDARVAESSRNPDLESLLGGRPRVLLLTKNDLADPRVTARWMEVWSGQGLSAVPVNAVTGDGLRAALHLARSLTEERRRRRFQRNLLPTPLRVMVVGIPNVGKSSLINYLSRRSPARVADRPGVTRGKQWIKVDREAQFLDLPGLLPPRGLSAVEAYRLAAVGALPEGHFDLMNTAGRLLLHLRQFYPGVVERRYGLTVADDTGSGGTPTDGGSLQQEVRNEPEEMRPADWRLLTAIGAKRGFLLAGGAVDLEKAARVLLKDFRTGVLGRISLEEPRDG